LEEKKGLCLPKGAGMAAEEKIGALREVQRGF